MGGPTYVDYGERYTVMIVSLRLRESRLYYVT